MLILIEEGDPLKKIIGHKKMAIAVVCIAFIICVYLVIRTVNILRYRSGSPEDILYTSNVTSDIGYDVYLRPNVFIDKPYINNQLSFITPLIEYIKTSFTYNYVGDNNIPITYDYYIKATIVSKYTGSDTNATKPILNKDYILLDHKTDTAGNSSFAINENLDIKIDQYNNILTDFGNMLNIPLDSTLDISLVVTVDGEVSSNKEKVKMHKEHLVTMSIPLGVSVFDISVSKSFPDEEIVYSKEPTPLTTSYIMAIIHIALILAIVIVIYFYIRMVVNRDKNEFESKISKILREYDDRIVTVSNFVRYEKMEVVNVPDFDELLTLSDETLEPIIYWVKKDRNSREAWFSIIRDRILYCHIMIYPAKK